MRSLLALAASATLAAAHGIIDSITIDGTTYPSFDPRVDLDFPGGVKRITWGYQKTSAEGTGPVENVGSPNIACRFGPLVPPAIHAVARAGSNMTFQWTPWFGNHKGPVLTYMGLMSDDTVKVQDVNFFKIDENGFDPKTQVWGTDQLVMDNSTRTVTIPSDVKPGMYVVRHEIIGLHFAWRENKEKETSGAQPYPTCIKVQVIGTGTATPPGGKFPGTYNWRDPGILINTKYHANKYDVPGPAVYKGERNPPQGPVPIIKETGEMFGEQGQKYAASKLEHGRLLLSSVAADIRDGKTGEGGCRWEEGQDPSTAKCSPVNPKNPAYVGYAQPVGSPMYTDKPGSAMRGLEPPPAFFGNERKAVNFLG